MFGTLVFRDILTRREGVTGITAISYAVLDPAQSPVEEHKEGSGRYLCEVGEDPLMLVEPVACFVPAR